MRPPGLEPPRPLPPSLAPPPAVLGVRPTAPAFASYDVTPVLGGLDWAEGAVPSVNGFVYVNATRQGGVKVRGPAHVPCTVCLPRPAGPGDAELLLDGRRPPPATATTRAGGRLLCVAVEAPRDNWHHVHVLAVPRAPAAGAGQQPAAAA